MKRRTDGQSVQTPDSVTMAAQIIFILRLMFRVNSILTDQYTHASRFHDLRMNYEHPMKPWIRAPNGPVTKPVPPHI